MVAVAGNVVKIANGRREVTARFCMALPVLQINPQHVLVWTTSGCASTTSMTSRAPAKYFAVKCLGSGAVMCHRLRVFATQDRRWQTMWSLLMPLIHKAMAKWDRMASLIYVSYRHTKYSCYSCTAKSLENYIFKIYIRMLKCMSYGIPERCSLVDATQDAKEPSF
jgi:hypothetical protein